MQPSTTSPSNQVYTSPLGTHQIYTPNTGVSQPYTPTGGNQPYISTPLSGNNLITTTAPGITTTSYSGQPLGTTSYSGQPIVSNTYSTQPLGTTSYAGQNLGTTSYAGQTLGTTSYAGQTGPFLNEPGMGSPVPVMDEQVQRISSYQDPIKTDFGKIKAIEVLTFKEAELERTLNGITTFGTVGVLKILYFANYDRFVLSLNDWKYALLKRMPVSGAESSGVGPITFTLPTYNGFYTLTLPRANHLEGLKNFETILINNTRFSYKGTENILRGSTGSIGARSPDDRFRRLEMTPGSTYGGGYGEENYDPALSTSQYPYQFDDNAPQMSKGQRVKRGFKKFGFLFKKKLNRKERNNLNNIQARDIDSIKRTNEVQAPIHHFPRREVERWLTYNKEIANSLGYYAEAYQESSSPLGESRMRGYGSVDLGQGSLSNPIPLTNMTGISTIRPPLDDLGYSVGQLHASAVPHKLARNGTYSKPKWTDRVKSKIPGEHKYYGEKTPHSNTLAHSHSIHPHLGPRLEDHLGTSVADPTPGMIGTSYARQFGEGVTEMGPQSGQIAREDIPQTTSVNYTPMTNVIPERREVFTESIPERREAYITETLPERREVYTTERIERIPETRETYTQPIRSDIPADHLSRDIGSNTNIVTTTEPIISERVISQGEHIPINTTNTSTITPTFVHEETKPTIIERIEDKLEGRTINNEGLVQPTMETGSLPSLSERIRNTTTTTTGVTTGLPVESLPIIGGTSTATTTGTRLSPVKPSFLQRVRNVFGGNEPINQEHVDVIRGGNAHYEA